MKRQEAYVEIEKVYREHKPAMLGILSKWGTARTEGHDIIQDTFVNLMENWDKYDPADYSRIVYESMKQRRVDHMRRFKGPFVQSDAVDIRADSQDIEYDLIIREELGDVGDQIAALKKSEHRDILTMFFLYQVDQKEIQGALGVTEDTVKSCIRNFRRELLANAT